MTDKELDKLIVEYLVNQPDTDEEEWYCTPREFAESIMEDFRNFLRDRGKII